MEFGIASVAGITVICYLAAQAVKATNLDNKWLPVICGVLGGILGVVGLYWIPEYPAQDIITAIAVGIMSGLGHRRGNPRPFNDRVIHQQLVSIRSISSYQEKKWKNNNDAETILSASSKPSGKLKSVHLPDIPMNQ